MENVLDKCLTPTCEMIMNIMEIENALINTNHPDFVGSADSLLNLFKEENESLGSNEEQKTYSLFNRVKKDQQDSLEDFQIEGESEEPKIKAEDKQKNNLTQSQLQLEVDNQELKNSMFQNVFGYQSQDLVQPKRNRTDTKSKTGGISVFGGYEFSQPDKSNLPGVVLPDVPVTMRAAENQESARVVMETRVIQNLIHSYFQIVKTNISDLVPKTVMAFLINESRKIAQSELVSQIYKSGNIETLLVEDPMIVQNRINCRKVLLALR